MGQITASQDLRAITPENKRQTEKHPTVLHVKLHI